MNGAERQGFDLAVYILPTLLALVGLVTIVALRAWRRGVARRRSAYSDDGELWGLASIFLTIATLILLAITASVAIPFQPRYWSWYLVEGRVEAVSNTLRDASGDLTTSPVVTIDGIEAPVVVDDPRIVTMTGQTVSLSCQPVWHFRGADSYSCRIYNYGGAA